MRTKLNFNHLECFLVTARTLSFTKTSEELMIAQPAVSKQIKSLEDSLGVQLLIRNRQGVTLTEEGKKLLERSSLLYQTLCEEVTNFQSQKEIHGTIRIGCLTEVGEKVFIKAFSGFKSLYPQIRLEINLLKTYEIIDGLKSGAYDMGIIPEKIMNENIRCYEIFREEIILTTSKKNSNKETVKITDLPFISCRENDPLLNFFIKEVSPRANQSRLKIEMTVNSHKAVAYLLQEHPYYAVLPKLSIESELSAKKLVQVGSRSIHSKLYLIMKDLNIPDKKLEVLRDYLSKFLKNY